MVNLYLGLMIYYFLKQKVNDGIVMVNFYPGFINCTDPSSASLEDVAGQEPVHVCQM